MTAAAFSRALLLAACCVVVAVTALPGLPASNGPHPKILHRTRMRHVLADAGIAEATATASATSVGATATATATADVNTPPGDASSSWNASTCLWSATGCVLNPAYLFSLPPPNLGAEKLLLQITAMRYACLNHTDEVSCSSDTPNWCTFDEDSSQCRLYYDDADFVGMLLWSATSIACKGSRLQEVVACSMYVAQQECTAAACEWAEQACYPPWYAGMIDIPKLLGDFKDQVHAADPEVWGDCMGAQLYKRYAIACDYPNEQTCAGDARCQWVQEYETEVAPNPLNFTQPCSLRTTNSPIETVYLGPGAMAGNTLTQQKACSASSSTATCTASVAQISARSLKEALGFAASTQPSTAEDAAFAASSEDDVALNAAVKNTKLPPGSTSWSWGPQAMTTRIVWAPAWVQHPASTAGQAPKPPPQHPSASAPAPSTGATGGSRCVHFICSAVQRSLWKLRVLPLPPLSRHR